MARQGREAVAIAAHAAFLRTYPPEYLDRLLEALGVPLEARGVAQRKHDPRRCLVCGHGYVRCRAVEEKAAEDDRHDWSPDRSRSDV